MTIPEDTRPPGRTTIATDVLLEITRLAALEVEGVSRLDASHSMDRLLKGGHQSGGVRVQVSDGVVSLDIYVVLRPDQNIRRVSREIQASAARAVNEMVGMQVGQVNIHIEDIDFEGREA
jgi:uncharacterized alkaline shock family protein YloU